MQLDPHESCSEGRREHWSLAHPSSVEMNSGKPLWRATLVVLVASEKHTAP